MGGGGGQLCRGYACRTTDLKTGSWGTWSRNLRGTTSQRTPVCMTASTMSIWGCNGDQFSRSLPMFRRDMSPSISKVEKSQNFGKCLPEHITPHSTVKITGFRDVMTMNLVDSYRRFEGTCLYYLYPRRRNPEMSEIIGTHPTTKITGFRDIRPIR
jgi:hypothetical protein